MKAANIGKILGAFGLILLLSSPFTLFLTSGSVAITVTKAVVGAVLLGVYFATNFKQFGQFASKRSSFFFASASAMVWPVTKPASSEHRKATEAATSSGAA